jgi:hypothetical protein
MSRHSPRTSSPWRRSGTIRRIKRSSRRMPNGAHPAGLLLADSKFVRGLSTLAPASENKGGEEGGAVCDDDIFVEMVYRLKVDHSLGAHHIRSPAQTRCDCRSNGTTVSWKHVRDWRHSCARWLPRRSARRNAQSWQLPGRCRKRTPARQLSQPRTACVGSVQKR